MFQNMQICIIKSKINIKFMSEKNFSSEVLIFPDFRNIESKFPDNLLIFQ